MVRHLNMRVKLKKASAALQAYFTVDDRINIPNNKTDTPSRNRSMRQNYAQLNLCTFNGPRSNRKMKRRMKGDVLFNCVEICNEDEEIKDFLKLSLFLIIIIKQPPRLANKEVGAGFLKTLP